MSASARPSIKITAPDTAFQQMCNYVAIAETKNPAESLRALILHMLYTFEEEKASTLQDVARILKTMFGIDAPDHQIQESLDQLMSAGQVHQPMGTNYVLIADARTKVKARIDQASKLQERVRMQWLAETIGQFSDLDTDLLWSTLQDYLAKAFLRHGIQVAVFLDPSVELPTEYAASLSTILADAVRSKFDSTRQEAAKHAISDFLASVGKNPDRARFIAECADGAANYFSLAISPDVSAQFREELSPLVLFCDTNFLFGILDLHVHPLVEVSNHLLEAIAKHNLPLKLRYHETTLRELQASVSHYADTLRRHLWSRALSRAATTSRFMSGIELKYHQRNAETGIDVNTFLRPYRHIDVLLTERGISIYRSPADRLTERATLEAEYEEFLKRQRKEKPYELISHDATVLDSVRSLRNSAQSTLEAGALLVTCDYTLYRFDREASRNANALASVVLPNVLWQILRPFIPASQDFDRSFAETFAIPEFRTIGSGAAKACSKMLGLLAAYKDFPEETAVKLLSNDLLIDSLHAAENDEEFQGQVESAIASENQNLLEERATLERQLEKEKVRRGKEASAHAENQKKYEQEQTKSNQDLQAVRQELTATQRAMEEHRKAAETAASRVLATKRSVDAAVSHTNERKQAVEKLEQRAHRMSVLAGFSLAALLVLGFELAVYLVPWQWMLSHRNTLPLQIGTDLTLLCGMLGATVNNWRKWCWGVGVVALVVTLLTLLGG